MMELAAQHDGSSAVSHAELEPMASKMRHLKAQSDARLQGEARLADLLEKQHGQLTTQHDAIELMSSRFASMSIAQEQLGRTFEQLQALTPDGLLECEGSELSAFVKLQSAETQCD